MENASKALLIAAAIIIAVVLISLGVMVLNNGSNLVKDNSDMSEVEITGFNSKFSQYFGKNVRGANVISLINAVNTNNASTDDDSKKITLYFTDSEGKEAALGKIGKTTKYDTSSIKTGKSYEVAEKSSTSGGLISEISIKEK